MGWTWKELAIASLLTAILFVVALFILEVSLAILRPVHVQRDALLGWKLKEDFRRTFPQKTLGGREFAAVFSTNHQGYRVFGTNPQAPVKILVLGDSFTADPFASNEQMWYVKMTERLAERTHRPLRDFYGLAGGAGGWGTYQYLLLSEHFPPPIRPSLFVLQFCSNDFQNNSFELERQGIARAQYMRRPYMDMNGEGPKYAPGIMGGIYRSFVGESHIFNKIDGLIGALQYKSYGGYIKPLPLKVRTAYERDAVVLTKDLLVRLREKYRGVPAVMVNCDGNEKGLNGAWKLLAREAGFIPVSAPSDFMNALTPAQRDTFMNADGSHFSETGNQAFGAIAGDAIAALKLPSLQ